MKSLVHNIKLQFNEQHQPELVLALSLSPQQAQEGVNELKEVLAKGKKLQATIEATPQAQEAEMQTLYFGKSSVKWHPFCTLIKTAYTLKCWHAMAYTHTL